MSKTFDELYQAVKVEAAQKDLARRSVQLQLTAAELKLETMKLDAERGLDSIFLAVKDTGTLDINAVLNQMVVARDLTDAVNDIGVVRHDLFPEG